MIMFYLYITKFYNLGAYWLQLSVLLNLVVISERLLQLELLKLIVIETIYSYQNYLY